MSHMHLLCNVRRGEVNNNSLLLHNRRLDTLHEDVSHELGHKVSVEKDVHKPRAGNFIVINDFRGGQTSQYRLGHLAGWEGLTLCFQGLEGGEEGRDTQSFEGNRRMVTSHYK